MGTTFHIECLPPKNRSLNRESVEQQVRVLLEQVNMMASVFEPESVISRFNRHKSTAPFPVSPEAALLVKQALNAARATSGAYDPTILPVIRLFGFAAEKKSLPPDPDSIRAARTRVGYENVLVDESGNLVKSHPEVELDLGGMAKGYAVDLVCGLFAGMETKSFLVEIGGEVRTRGTRPDGKPWRIGIEKPMEDAPFGGSILAVIQMENACLATSGDYRSYRKSGNARVHHIFDPRTGSNPDNRLASVSVIAKTCARADALATGFMVLDPDKGMKLAGNLPDVEALFVLRLDDGSFEIRHTDGFPLRPFQVRDWSDREGDR